MACLSTAPDGYIRIGIPSGVFNVVNFIVFDILFASLLFHLTCVIGGLVNCSTAVKGLQKRLSAFEPPLVGGDLTCTSRNVPRIFTLIRGT